MAKLWFRARTYGWGWTPCSLAGWLVTIVGAVLLVGGDLVIVASARDPEMLQSPAVMIGVVLAWNVLIVGAMLIVCWLTGERPRWHWGKSGP